MVPPQLTDEERRLFGRAGDGLELRPEAVAVTRALANSRGLDLDTFSRAAGMHPERVRWLVALGLLEAHADAAGELWFPPAQLSAAARVQRLRAGFGLNYVRCWQSSARLH